MWLFYFSAYYYLHIIVAYSDVIAARDFSAFVTSKSGHPNTETTRYFFNLILLTVEALFQHDMLITKKDSQISGNDLLYVLFQFVYFCMFIYLCSLGNFRTIDPDKFLKQIP